MKPFFANIMVGVSGSESSVMAAKYAIAMAKSYNCKLSAVYVVDTATIRKLSHAKIFVKEEGREYEDSLKLDGENYLSFIEELAVAKGLNIDKIIRNGAVFSEILAAAEEKHADLLILGGWDRNRGPREQVYTTYREIMANAKCSILIAKDPNIDQMYKHA